LIVVLDLDLPFDELKRRAHINEAARAADQSPDFSRLIRAGRPGWNLFRDGCPFGESVEEVARRADGYVLVRTRPPRGLLGGMTEVPTTEWSKDFDESSSLSDAPLLFSPLPDGEREIFWRRRAGTVRHVFTHFPLELAVYLAEVPENAPAPAGMRWIAIAELGGEALPTLMRKVLAHALGERSEASPPPSRRVPSRAARR